MHTKDKVKNITEAAETEVMLLKTSFSLVSLVTLTFISLIIFVAFIFFSSSLLEKNIKKGNNLQLLYEMTMSLVSIELDMRHLENDFLWNFNRGNIKQYNLLADKALDILNQIKERRLKGERGEKIYSDLYQNIQQQMQYFELMTMMHKSLGFTAEEGKQGRVRSTAHLLELYLTKDPPSSLKTALFITYLKMRKAEKDFTIWGIPRYISIVHSEIKKIITQPHAATPKLQKIHEEVKTLINHYQREFDEYVKSYNMRELYVKELENTFKVFMVTLGRAIDHINDTDAANQTAASENIAFIKNTTSFFAFTILALVGLYGIFIIRRVAIILR